MKLKLAIAILLAIGIFALGRWEGKRAADEWWRSHGERTYENREYDSVISGWTITGNCHFLVENGAYASSDHNSWATNENSKCEFISEPRKHKTP